MKLDTSDYYPYTPGSSCDPDADSARERTARERDDYSRFAPKESEAEAGAPYERKARERDDYSRFAPKDPGAEDDRVSPSPEEETHKAPAPEVISVAETGGAAQPAPASARLEVRTDGDDAPRKDS